MTTVPLRRRVASTCEQSQGDENHQGRYCPVALALMAALWPQAGWSESYFNPAFVRRHRQRGGFVAF
jgi:hypothetical protein